MSERCVRCVLWMKGILDFQAETSTSLGFERMVGVPMPYSSGVGFDAKRGEMVCSWRVGMVVCGVGFDTTRGDQACAYKWGWSCCGFDTTGGKQA